MEAPPLTERDPLSIAKPEEQKQRMELQRQPSQIAKVRVLQLGDEYKAPAIGTSLIIYLVLNVIMLCVGAITFHDCPIKPIIPIYLIVAGSIGIVTKILPIINQKFLKRQIVEHFLGCLFFIEFVWMILGSVWIYSIYEPPYEPTGDELYCNKTTYLFAFWLLTLNYIFLVIMISIPCLIFCCFCICACCFAKANEEN
ncbi:hypothetical protein FQR65_LT06048 [Abscondita terminalis]|nr:hypothetical protein FQR65_LT06048 [Abscondita terminalis]